MKLVNFPFARRIKIIAIALLVSFGFGFPGLTFAIGLVNLGSAANYAILSKTGVSTTGTTVVNGDIGVSSTTATALTGFGLSLDASNKFSTSALVNGKLYAADYAVPTPATLTTAISDMEAAYSEAASRPIPTATGRSAGDIGGLTFTPGLYKWNTGVTINSDITLMGGAEDVWIFQIAENLDVASLVKVIFTNGEQAKNIFWQVGGQATLGTNAVFAGNILSHGAIVLKNGTVLKGRALAQTAVTLDANIVTVPDFVAAVVTPVVPVVATTAPAVTVTAVSAIPVTPVVPTVQTPTAAITVASVQAKLNTLVAAVQVLLTHLQNAGIALPSQTQTLSAPTSRFTRSLSLGSKGDDVVLLQSFLIEKKIGMESERLTTVGATGYFGSLTQKALSEFQKSVQITPSVGYFGPKTIRFINSL